MVLHLPVADANESPNLSSEMGSKDIVNVEILEISVAESNGK